MGQAKTTLTKVKNTKRYVRYDDPEGTGEVMNNAYVSHKIFGTDGPDDLDSYPDEINITIDWED